MNVTLLRRVVSIFFILLSGYCSCAYSYDNEISHKDLTRQSALFSNIRAYLKDFLGFKNDIATKFPTYSNETISRLLQHGSELEDVPDCRASNHFHNPLEPWADSYLTDDNDTLLGLVAVRANCNIQGWTDRKSNITWATGFLDLEGTKAVYAAPPYDWDMAREKYYQALTALMPMERDALFAQTFETLGHVLHLLQDVSVPAHVRNDLTSHLIFSGIDGITPQKWFKQPFEYYIKNHPQLVTTVESNKVVTPTFNDLKLTDFWDTDFYDGTLAPPDSAILSYGLAESTNANYLSDSTIPNNTRLDLDDEHVFPFPQINNAEYTICEEELIPIVAPVTRKYISRKNRLTDGICPSPEQKAPDHFAAVSFLNSESDITDENIDTLDLYLDDDKIHKTYAKELIPRAIGYSAALLDYFFRGKLEIVAPPIIYLNNITNLVKLKVKNVTETQERMQAGNFELVLRYTPMGANPDGSEDIFLNALDNTDQDFKIPCSELNYNDTMDLTFEIPSFLEPLASGDSLSFMLVFRGTLGNEEGAVIGKYFVPDGVELFAEEWENGLTGNYAWTHTTEAQMPNNGSTGNEVQMVSENGTEDGVLFKDNIREQGYDTNRINESYLSFVDAEHPEGMLIDANTYLQFKIDDLSINTQPPASPGQTSAWQVLELQFNDNLFLLFSTPGQNLNLPNSITYTFVPGPIVVENITDALAGAGVPVPEPLYLKHIDFVQNLAILQDPSSEMNHQHMEVDSIRIIEGTVQ